jgi:hypothetical protein
MKAHQVYYAVQKAIEEGELQRGVCEICGNPEVQGHHDDYSKPDNQSWPKRKRLRRRRPQSSIQKRRHPVSAAIDFSDWSQKRFVRWLYKNYPQPEGCLVGVTLNVDHGKGAVEKTTMADDYEICMNELAFELALNHREKDIPQYFKDNFPKPKVTFFIRPAKRRKKKKMWLRFPNQNEPPPSGQA